MVRPKSPRRVASPPTVTYFKPRGIPLADLEETVLSVDEMEALRLADFLALYQEEGARSMGVSRPTFARIVESARHKVAEALTRGLAIRIEGGIVEWADGDKACHCRKRGCARCRARMLAGGAR